MNRIIFMIALSYFQVSMGQITEKTTTGDVCANSMCFGSPISSHSLLSKSSTKAISGGEAIGKKTDEQKNGIHVTLQNLNLSPKVSDLLQHNAHAFEAAGVDITPGVKATIGQLIEMIETSILEEVKKHHQATQINSTNSVETLRQRTTLAVEKHEGASEDDRKYVACARSLEQCHSDHKSCVDVENTMDRKRNESCTTSRGKQNYTSSDSPAIIDLPVLVCDFAQPISECKYDDWKASLGRWADDRIAPEVKLSRDEYVNARRICRSDTKDHWLQKEKCEGMKSDCNDRELNCDELERRRDVSMCTFGDRLRSKCEAKSENELLASQINGSGSVHSDSDRRHEWISGSLIKCMLMKHRQGADFDESAMMNCQDTPSYDDEVGILNLEQEAVGQLTSAEKFDCVQNAINFSGVEVVKTPGSPYPAFSFTSPFTSTVSLDPKRAPFDVCTQWTGSDLPKLRLPNRKAEHGQ